MKKSHIIGTFIVSGALLLCSSCGLEQDYSETPSASVSGSEFDTSSAETSAYNQPLDYISTSESNAATEISESNITTDPENEAIVPEAIHGIEIAEYIDPYRVSEYYNLTEDQQIAFSALCDALNDIINNGPTPYKSYPLPKRITWFDYKLALNLLTANYTAMENFISNLFSEDISDEISGIKYCEGFYLYGYDAAFLDEEYSKFMQINSTVDEILSSLDHDGTEYGKAYSIAKWMVDNITYPDNYKAEDYLSTAYTVFTKNEAICGGYAKAFDFLCKKAGLETIYLDGLNHAWNMIRINGKWYHIDATWMDNEKDYYKYFMMTDSICYSTGHKEWSYYWDQENNINISPIADSDDLYYYSVGFQQSEKHD